MSLIDIREECKNYALKWIDIQRKQFKRLGVFGTWENPYLTMDPEYEGEIIRFLAAFIDSGNVFKGKKPVYWCSSCRTALAEAEIEYKDHDSPSIYVKFPLVSDLTEKYPALKGKQVSVLIWTTTPWTIPANLAIAFHPDFDYVAFEAQGEVFITAQRLVPVLAETLGFKTPKILAVFPGREMEGLKAGHPFIDRESIFVLADYVTLEQGTGAVHTAPGHGHDDYLTGLKYKLDIYTPVDGEGRFIPELDKYGGLNVFAANDVIVADMQKDGTLLKTEIITHSYPHCWRCKKPVIFRATAQWFISMDQANLRERALAEIKKVNWIPYWGEERIANMMSTRPDWCISRQRSWGVPIPAFFCEECGFVMADKNIALFVADIFAREGSNSWFKRSSKELLPEGTCCPQCRSKNLEKEHNILDVWFESGTSHNILGKKDELPWPADIYIEGHDQYRGWFNSSLLVGVAAKNRSPYKTCITHGFVLDEQGRAMSKSLGNVIAPKEIIDRNGAEILRLWVAMLNFKEDARFGKETLQRLVEAYRKIRNTWRFILGNLHDFSPDEAGVSSEEMEAFDKWILERNNKIGKKMIKGYSDYEFHTMFHTLYNYFTVDLSSYYLDVLKDRLYCSGKNSRIRRSAQTALFNLLRSTLILLAPILPFTAEEAWEAMPDFAAKSESVHLEQFPDFDEVWITQEEDQDWATLGEIREAVLKELELARENKLIGNSLEAKVTLFLPTARRELILKYSSQLADLFIVSDVEIKDTSDMDVSVKITRVEWEKCQRCWGYSEYIGTSPDYPEFCQRCTEVVKGIYS